MTAAAPAQRETAPAPRTQTGAPEEMIRIENATVRFGNLHAVRDVSLTVLRGTILGLIGPSGAGKTTTIRLLTGSLEPTEGRVIVMGERPRRFRRRTRELIGYMPQNFTLYPDLTAGENVDFVASLFGLLWLKRRRRVREVLGIVDLWEARKQRASNLSGGQQRRLELACALVHEPELLFLDEPTAGNDPLLRARVWEELHRIKADGRTLLVTTQYINEAEECDNVALIAEGRLVALAAPEELRRMATGGDVIELETTAPYDAVALEALPYVRAITQRSPRSIRVVVDDAGTATPTVVGALQAAGADIVSSREYRLSFDEIFSELVERHRRESGSDEDPAEREARERLERERLEREGEEQQREAREREDREAAPETDRTRNGAAR